MSPRLARKKVEKKLRSENNDIATARFIKASFRGRQLRIGITKGRFCAALAEEAEPGVPDITTTGISRANVSAIAVI
jgi:hypothetical protein